MFSSVRKPRYPFTDPSSFTTPRDYAIFKYLAWRQMTIGWGEVLSTVECRVTQDVTYDAAKAESLSGIERCEGVASAWRAVLQSGFGLGDMDFRRMERRLVPEKTGASAPT